jgi:single-strand DNA-binding protein
MSNFNKIILMGNLTKDLEVRYTPSNIAVGNFSLAVNTTIGKDADGKPKTETLFVDITVFGKQAETISQYCKKGSPLFVEGRLRLRTWEDKDGNKHSKHEVVLSGFQFLNSNKKEEPADVESIPVGDEDVPF